MNCEQLEKVIAERDAAREGLSAAIQDCKNVRKGCDSIARVAIDANDLTEGWKVRCKSAEAELSKALADTARVAKPTTDLVRALAERDKMQIERDYYYELYVQTNAKCIDIQVLLKEIQKSRNEWKARCKCVGCN